MQFPHNNRAQPNANIDLINKKVAIVGFGIEGISSARFLKKKGADVWVLDKKLKVEIEQEFVKEAEALGCHFTLGDSYLINLSDFDVIVRSPGIKLSTKELAEASKKGILITSHTKIFFDLCPSPIIGVTGTKGKGTTASLIHAMLRNAGIDVYLGGNIGTPPLDFLDTLTADSWVILELSSFQLQDLTRSSHVAVMLMITSEHLDYHKDINEYVWAKRNLLRHQTPHDFAILNRDYIATNESDIYTPGRIFTVSREREADQGCFIRDNAVWVRVDETEYKIIDVSDIVIPGKHNLENVCSAVMSAVIVGIPKEIIKSTLTSFQGLPHRLEFIREVNGVMYYDDSFSTTPETAIAAIDAFTQPEILILGGSGKNSDFTELIKVIRASAHIKAIIGIGDEWKNIRNELTKEGNLKNILLVEGATRMAQVVSAAHKIGVLGDVVLLSPACASFGMFKNYKDRGEQFKKQVSLL